MMPFRQPNVGAALVPVLLGGVVGLLSCRAAPPISDRPAPIAPEAGAGSATPPGSAAAAGRATASAHGPVRAVPGKRACGFTPRGPRERNRAFFRYRLGCGVSRKTWRDVVDVNPAAIHLGPKKSVVWIVFTDAAGKRVLPLGRTVTYDFRFRTRRRGTITLGKSQARDGVFRLELPGNDFAKPCRSHLYLYFHNGTKRLEAWIDDWRYRC